MFIFRIATNTDVFNRLMVSSDPLISHFQNAPSTIKRRPLSDAVRGLLAGGPDSNNNEKETDDDESDDLEDKLESDTD